MNTRYSIYALINPITDEMFYIGKTNQKIEKRLECHLHDHSNHKNPRGYKTEVIISILSQNKKPLIKEIDHCYGLTESLEREKIWIYELYRMGMPIKNREVTPKRWSKVYYTPNFPYGVAVFPEQEIPTSLLVYGKAKNKIDPEYVVDKSHPCYLEIPEEEYSHSIHQKLISLRNEVYPFLKLDENN